MTRKSRRASFGSRLYVVELRQGALDDADIAWRGALARAKSLPKRVSRRPSAASGTATTTCSPRLCRAAQLAQLGHVALEATKIQANASGRGWRSFCATRRPRAVRRPGRRALSPCRAAFDPVSSPADKVSMAR